MRKTLAFVLVPILVAAGVQGCGKKDQAGGPQAPTAGVGSGPMATPGTTGPGGPAAQIGMSDAPSSGEAANRPKMADAARGPYMSALQAFGRGDLLSAKKLFLEAIDKDPKSYQAHYSLGVILERLGDADSLSRYRRAFSIVPDYEPALTAYALHLARRGNKTEADSFLTERHAKLPKSAAVAAALAEVKSIQGDTGSAQKLAQKALKLNPNYPPAMITLARDHYRNRRLDLARYALQAILDGFGVNNPPRDKENPEARLLRALILKEEGRRMAAIKEMEHVVARRPDLVEAGTQLGTYYLESGNANRALPLLERALRYDKGNLVAHMNLGDCYRLLGRSADAKREFEWVLRKDSSMIQAHYNMGLLYLFSASFPGLTPVQQTSKAIAAFEKYKELRGRSTATEGSDVDELITRAKSKKAMVEAEQKASKPAKPPASAPKDAKKK